MRGVNLLTLAVILTVLFVLLTPPTVAVPAVFATWTAFALLEVSVLCATRGDVVANTGFSISLYPVAVTADKAKDVGVDIRNAESVAFVGIAGAIDTAGLVKLVPQECDTLGGVYTDVAAADLDGAFTNFAANSMQKVGYKGTKDFVALRADYTSGTSVVCGGFIVKGNVNIREVA